MVRTFGGATGTALARVGRAGNGFACSFKRRKLAGLGRSDRIVSMPSGAISAVRSADVWRRHSTALARPARASDLLIRRFLYGAYLPVFCGKSAYFCLLVNWSTSASEVERIVFDGFLGLRQSSAELARRNLMTVVLRRLDRFRI